MSILEAPTDGDWKVRVKRLVVLLAGIGGCAQLHFLKSPSVPRPIGESATSRGPASRRNPSARHPTRHVIGPATTIDNPDAPFTAEGTRFCPGVNGGVEWNGPSYSPATNTLYVNSIDWCTTVRVAPPSKLEGKDGLPWTGSSELRQPFGTPDSARRGWLTAVNADDGHVEWKYASPTPLVAGITATAGGVVFTGDLNGDVLAFDAKNGQILWRSNTGQPIGGGVASYAAGNRQFIAVASGMHSPLTWQLKSSPAKVVVFSLP